MRRHPPDIVAENFEVRTGIDLRDYRRPEILRFAGDLNTIRTYAIRSVLIPLACSLVVTSLLAVLAAGTWATLAALVFIPVFTVLNTLVVAAVLFILRLRGDVTQAVRAGLGLTREVTRDVRNLYLKRERGTLSLPSAAETLDGIMRVVVIPLTTSMVKSRVPIVGGFFSSLAGGLTTLATRRSVQKLVLEHPEVFDVEPPDAEKEAWVIERLEDLSGLADGTAETIAQSITWASRALLAPVLIVSGIVWAATVFCYWLIL